MTILESTYIGFTINIKKIKKNFYKVTVQHLAYRWDNYQEQDDVFELKKKEWIFDTIIEAMIKYNYIKNQIKNLIK